MSYILFYSNYCKYSHKFINILEKSGEASFFAKICVDKDPQTGNRPPIINKYNIKEVPTIIVENQKLQGYDAFRWLQSRIENSQDQVNGVHSRQNKQPVNIQQLNQNQSKKSAPEPFSYSNNFLDLSDTSNTTIYTPSQDEDITSKKGNFILQDDNITSCAIDLVSEKTVPSSLTKDKLKTKQFENEFNKLMAERDNDIPKPLQRM